MPAGLKLIRLLKAGCCPLDAGAKKPSEPSMAADEGVAAKVAVKPPVAGVAGKLTR
jgi:hypothetical protein